MRVLVTNDDGISSEGLHQLAIALVDAGHQVVIVAPKVDCSGFGAAIGPLHLTGQVEFERVTLDGVDAPAFAVDGPPALCVLATALGGFGPRPELVASGINAGTNTGRAVLHSGTVGAALTALNFGIPAIAVSQVIGEGQNWAGAAELAARFATRVVTLRPPVVVNLNVPNVALSDLRGTVVAKLDPGGTVQAAMFEKSSGVLQFHLPERPANRAGTDTALVEDGYATISAVVGPHALAIDLARFVADADDLRATPERVSA